MKSAYPIDARVPPRDLPAEGYVFSRAWNMTTGDMDRRQQLRLDGPQRTTSDKFTKHAPSATGPFELWFIDTLNRLHRLAAGSTWTGSTVRDSTSSESCAHR